MLNLSKSFLGFATIYFLFTVLGCSSGGSDTDPVASVCNSSDPVLGAVDALIQSNITKDPCQTDSPQAIEQGQITDNSLDKGLSPLRTSLHDSLITRLKQEASISSTVPIMTVSDIQCVTPVGGGATGANLVFVDGKFLDILSEFATYLTLFQTGQATMTPEQAINTIVNFHQLPAFYCTNVPPNNFIKSNLSPSLQSQADGILDSLGGAILYHEYGHYWAHGVADTILLNSIPGGRFYYYPSKVEDDADFIAGVLTKKANHNLDLAQAMIDIMAFYVLQRNYGVPTIENIVQSYQLQFLPTNPSYSSLVGRKNLIAQGYQLTP